MDWLAELATGRVLLLTLILGRIGALAATAPVLGGREVPPQIRALLAFAMTLLVFPTQWQTPLPPVHNLVDYLLIMAGELGIGLCLGLGVQILLSGVQLAGQLIGRVSGESLGEVYDPNLDESSALLSHLLYLLALAVFLCIGGHRLVLSGLLDTFTTIPVGQAAPPCSKAVVELLVDLLAGSFTLGIRAAAPTVTALLVATVVMGLLSRTLPQLNVMALGFGLNSLTTYVVLGLSLGTVAWLFQDEVDLMLRPLLDAL